MLAVYKAPTFKIKRHLRLSIGVTFEGNIKRFSFLQTPVYQNPLYCLSLLNIHCPRRGTFVLASPLTHTSPALSAPVFHQPFI